MANPDTPFGMRPAKHLNGMAWNGQTMRCYAPSTYAVALFVGDPVVLSGTGDTAGVAPEVNVATVGDGNKIFGVITAFDPDDNQQYNYRPASTARYMQVCCDPDVLFEIQGCSSAALGAATIGLNAVLVKTHSGSTITGQSGVEMDSGAAAAPGTNGSYQLLVLAAVDRPDNDITYANAKWLVMINLHTLRAVDAAGGGAAEGPKGA
jgi:hypothetical protein